MIPQNRPLDSLKTQSFFDSIGQLRTKLPRKQVCGLGLRRFQPRLILAVLVPN
jgi:hypothetical protein